MANLLKCKRCGADIKGGPTATNQRFCGVDCRETWWNERRSKGVNQAMVSASRLGSAAPMFDLTDVQASWLAALIDGEGTIGIWREARRQNRSGWRYKAAVQVGNTNFDIIARVRAMVDGFVITCNNAKRKNPKHKTLYRITVNQRAVASLLENIQPYLVIKGRQAEMALAFCRAMNEAPMRASADHEIFERLYMECKALNKRGT